MVCQLGCRKEVFGGAFCSVEGSFIIEVNAILAIVLLISGCLRIILIQENF
jgi:hypothetical protein